MNVSEPNRFGLRAQGLNASRLQYWEDCGEDSERIKRRDEVRLL